MAIITLNTGIQQQDDPNIYHKQVDIDLPRITTKDGKQAFNRLADFVTGTESKAQLSILKSIEGIDFSKLTDKDSKPEREQPLEERALQTIARFSSVDHEARNKLTKLFFDLVKSVKGVLTFEGKQVSALEIESLDAKDEVLIASCFVTNFILS